MSLPRAVELRSVTKDYPVGLGGVRLRALDNISLTIESGNVFGLLGPNGSGKSTAIKIMLGLVPATLGSSEVFGRSTQDRETRRLIGYLPEAPDFYRHLTGRQLVKFYGELCEVRGARLRSRVAEVIDWVGLSAAADRRVGTYSKGMLQRIGLAQALVHDPELLILDEPTAGVDPIASAAMTDLILKLKAAKKTILITSHQLPQIEEVCDRVAILDHGKIILESDLAKLLGRRPEQLRTLRIDSLQPNHLDELTAWLGARGTGLTTDVTSKFRLEHIYGATIAAHRAGSAR